MTENPNAQQISQAGPHNGSSGAQSQVRQEDGNSAEGREGIQSGGRGEAKAKIVELVAVAYDIRYDAWVALNWKQIRNPDHPAIIWMRPDTWTKLATHADSKTGEFYIPCQMGLTESHELRAKVQEMEK